MEDIQIEIGGRTFTFAVWVEEDTDAAPPWVISDCHGPVTDWTTRAKRPGELLLESVGTFKPLHRFYDYAEACRIALRDGWNTPPYDAVETKRQRAARAARVDFEHLRRWCAGEWKYVGVLVQLKHPDGSLSDIQDALWQVEDDPDNVRETARMLADELAGGFGVSWGEEMLPRFVSWK